MELTLNQVSKQYAPDKFGVRDFSLTLKTGIVGLLGPNGAGKSTLMKMITTVSRPTDGRITLNGTDIVAQPNVMREQLGYLPQDFGVYPNLTGREFLTYIAALKGIGGGNLSVRVDQLLEGVNLTDAAGKRIGTYSGGMRQRVGIAQVLLNDPKVLVFDEPTVGLDPQERVRFRNLISDLANDCIVILSSHIVSDIETIADEVVIMKDGHLIGKGFQREVVERVRGKVFETEINRDALADFRKDQLIISTVRRKDGVTVRFIASSNVGDARPVDASLEDAYLYLSN